MLSKWDLSGLRFKRGSCTGIVDLLNNMYYKIQKRGLTSTH